MTMASAVGRREMRAEPRVAVSCRGTLTVGDHSAPCEIQNMCSRGFLIKADKSLPTGTMLQLRAELDETRAVECTVQVRHVNRECLGAKVVDITERELALCRAFIEEQRGRLQ